MDCGTETVTFLHTSGLLWLFSAVSTICLTRFRHCSFVEILLLPLNWTAICRKNHTLHL